mmetsp:Transcript_65476/g.104264  ORF Transcript_65476/g.104264 Transcript_65476/m.104264 type:complete len:279 (-) Transcript_65476:592-1428(-)
MNERGFATAIGANHSNSRFQVEVHRHSIEQNLVRRVSKRDIPALDHRAAHHINLERKIKRNRASLHRLAHSLHVLQHFDAALHHARLLGIVSKAVNKRLNVRNLRLLRLVVFHLLLPFSVFHVHKRGEVALVIHERLFIQMDNLRRHIVEKLAIMRDDQQSAGKRLQVILQPDHRRKIQVVGRLVEQQHVRLHKQRASQTHSHSPAARQTIRGPRVHRVGKAQAQQNLPRLLLHVHAAQILHQLVVCTQLLLQFGDLLRHLRYRALVLFAAAFFFLLL